MDEVNKVLFIINKFAGTGYQPELEGRILTRSDAHDVETKILFTEGPGHATALALDAKNHGFGRVVAVGGDGTLNEVAQGLFRSQIPMGIIARGSGNGLARHLGIPLAIPAAIENVFTGSPLAMDTFTLNGKASVSTVTSPTCLAERQNADLPDMRLLFFRSISASENLSSKLRLGPSPS
jgi:diacylglycerol kinase family enzyme